MLVQLRAALRRAGKMSEDSLPKKLEANILVLGGEQVGKSALTVRFLTRRFIGEYGDIESIYTHRVTKAGRETCCSIWDSVGPQGQLEEESLRWADGFVVVYSICDRASFQVARQLLQRIRQLKRSGPRPAPIVLVGNKQDLRHQRAMSSEEGRRLALAAQAGFLEVSVAETCHGAVAVFHKLLSLVRGSRAAGWKAGGLQGLIRSVTAVFGRRRTE